jgi:hypothetical protein
MKTEDIIDHESALGGSTTPTQRLAILQMASSLVLEKKFGVFRLVDLCQALECYVLTGHFPVNFADRYQNIVTKAKLERTI